MERTDRQISNAFKHAMNLRQQMREDGATEAECARALEKIIRANWPVTDEKDWPYFHRLPRCIKCDGYGLVIRTVTNRLGCVVEEGTPCTCQAGTRYLERPKSEADFTAAGKTASAKPKGFSRWNG